MSQPKLKRDWVGRKVRLMDQVETKGGDIFAAGSVMDSQLWWAAFDLCRSVRPFWPTLESPNDNR